MIFDDFLHFGFDDVLGDDDSDATRAFEGADVHSITGGNVGEVVQGGRQLRVGRDLAGGHVTDEERLFRGGRRRYGNSTKIMNCGTSYLQMTR